MKTMLPNQPRFSPQQPPEPPVRPKRQSRWRLRWEYLWVILTVLLVAFLLTGVQPAFTWSELENAVGVRDREMYTRLGVLGSILVAVVWIRRVQRDDRRG
jgi:polyferredoxin